jgi:hypothetical protein
VEPDEAEWNLDVLEDLFDFYIVRPKAARDKIDALNAKLQQAGKRTIGPPTVPSPRGKMRHPSIHSKPVFDLE